MCTWLSNVACTCKALNIICVHQICASPFFQDYSHADSLGPQYKSVNFGERKGGQCDLEANQ